MLYLITCRIGRRTYYHVRAHPRRLNWRTSQDEADHYASLAMAREAASKMREVEIMCVRTNVPNGKE